LGGVFTVLDYESLVSLAQRHVSAVALAGVQTAECAIVSEVKQLGGRLSTEIFTKVLKTGHEVAAQLGI
jgi:hypothetical protein